MSPRKKPRARTRVRWQRLDDEALLAVRLCDLGLELERSPLQGTVDQLNEDLRSRGLRRFKPRFWLSSDWFSPDGLAGVALPFYLAHPRLVRLERKMMQSVEGGGADARLKLLRHEVGHALDNAYRLHERRGWREHFGPFSTPYEPHYRPQPYSRAFVQHLPHWYAQSHPAEDFAETFAVWLQPELDWRTRYAGWPALKKLDYVDRLMRDIATRSPHDGSRGTYEPLDELEITLGDYYTVKRKRYAVRFPFAFDRGLRRAFVRALPGDRRVSAAIFLRRIRPELVRRVLNVSDTNAYTVEQVLHDMIARARELKLVVDSSVASARLDAAVLLATQTMNFLHTGYHRVSR
jgi:hypothetical protein